MACRVPAPYVPIVLLCAAACSEYKVTPTAEPEAGGEDTTGTPVLLVEPATIDFGSLDLGDSATETVTVTNVGDAELSILDVSLEAEGGYTITSLSTVLLGPEMSGNFAVTYAPEWSQSDPFAGTITVESDAPSDAFATVELTGLTPTPALELSPTLHDFGTLDVGDSDSVVLTLTNTGEATATVSAASFTSSSEGELGVSEWGFFDTVPLTVAPGDAFTTTVAYAPTAEGSVEGTLSILSDDEANPELNAKVFGAAVVPEEDPCDKEYEFTIWLTADDAWQGWIDGVEFTGANQNTWTHSDEHTQTMGCGDHAIAIYGTDVGSVIAGFIAVVYVDGVPEILTGDGSWLMADTDPGTGWQDVGFDDSAWSTAIACASTSSWGTYWPADFYAAGAQWVWWTSSCSDLSEAWFRLPFTIE